MTRTSHNRPRQVGLFITHIQSPLFLIDSIGIVRFSGKEPPRCVIRLLLSQDCPPFTEIFKMMAVIQSRALPSTRMELEKIERHVPSDLLVKLGIPGATASVEVIATKLSDVAIIHFDVGNRHVTPSSALIDALLYVSRSVSF